MESWKNNLKPGKVLEKSWKIVSEKGYEPCTSDRGDDHDDSNDSDIDNDNDNNNDKDNNNNNDNDSDSDNDNDNDYNK